LNISGVVDLALVLVGPSVLIAVVVVYAVAMRTRHHYTSRLACPKCHQSFEYRWVPLASFSAVRLGKSRYLECPLCHEWSTYNVWDTRVMDSADRH
jgi:hypothetical protein